MDRFRLVGDRFRPRLGTVSQLGPDMGRRRVTVHHRGTDRRQGNRDTDSRDTDNNRDMDSSPVTDSNRDTVRHLVIRRPDTVRRPGIAHRRRCPTVRQDVRRTPRAAGPAAVAGSSCWLS